MDEPNGYGVSKQGERDEKVQESETTRFAAELRGEVEAKQGNSVRGHDSAKKEQQSLAALTIFNQLIPQYSEFNLNCILRSRIGIEKKQERGILRVSRMSSALLSDNYFII